MARQGINTEFGKQIICKTATCLVRMIGILTPEENWAANAWYSIFLDFKIAYI